MWGKRSGRNLNMRGFVSTVVAWTSNSGRSVVDVELACVGL